MSSSGPVRYIESIRERYARLGYEPYRWYQAENPPPFASLSKPLSEMRLGVLTTAGAYVKGQVAFHYKDDTSVREIPVESADEDLRFSHLTENYLVDPRRDPNCVLPLTALRAAREANQIGELANSAISCMGGIYSQRRVREELIPAITDIFERQQIDAALLLPM